MMKKQVTHRVAPPQSTTNKMARPDNIRSQFSRAQTLRRSRSKQASLVGGQGLLSADQLANLSVDQILAKYRLAQVPPSQEISPQTPEQQQQEHYQSQQQQQAQPGTLPKYRIKSGHGKVAKGAISMRRMSQEPELPRAHQFFEQGVQSHYPLSKYVQQKSQLQDQHALVDPSLNSHHKRHASGSIASSFVSTPVQASNDNYIHKQVFRALDKILSKFNQGKPQHEVHNKSAYNFSFLQRDNFTDNEAHKLEGSMLEQHHNASSGFQTARSNGNQIFFQQAPHTQPLVQLNSSYLLPTPPSMTSGQVDQTCTGKQTVSNSVDPSITSHEIDQLKSSTKALTQEVQEMRNAILAIRQSTSLTKVSSPSGHLQVRVSAPTTTASQSLINTQQSNLPSGRASPDSLKNQERSQFSKASFEKVAKERDAAVAEAERLRKETEQSKFAVKSLKDQTKKLEQENEELTEQLKAERKSLRDLETKQPSTLLLPKEIHSPGPELLEGQKAIEDRCRLLKDCQTLSTTVQGQARRIKEQDAEIAKLLEQTELLAADLKGKVGEAQDLERLLAESQSRVVEHSPQVQLQEVIKYVDNPNCKTCETLRTQLDNSELELSNLRDQVGILERDKSSDAAALAALEDERHQLKAQFEQLCTELKESRKKFDEDSQTAENKAATLERTVAELTQKISDQSNPAVEMKAKYEQQVKRLDSRLGDAVKKIKALNLDIQEYKEIAESKDYEIKMMQEQRETLIKIKGKKNAQQQIITQLNAQIEKDVEQIMEGRMREATLNKLVAKLQQEMAEMRAQ